MTFLPVIARARGAVRTRFIMATTRGPTAGSPWYDDCAMEGTTTTMEEPTGPSDRRHHPRKAMSVPARLSSNETFSVPCRTLDLSESGALLHGAAPLSIGQTVRLEVSRGGARNPARGMHVHRFIRAFDAILVL